MSLWVLATVLGAMLLIRFVYVAVQSRDFESFWYDLERQGLKFQIARAISFVTYGVYLACAVYALWTLTSTTNLFLMRATTLFVIWCGLSLLGRFPVHRFPRTNVPQLYNEAQTELITNLILSVLSGIAMTLLCLAYFWWRGL